MEVDRPGQGHHFHKVAIDEAASIPNLKRKFEESIQPTLLDYVGNWVMYSTPNGYNDFWGFYNIGLDPLKTDYSSFHFTSYDNPHMDTRELERIKSSTPSRTWQQEYLAQFVADGGQVFRGVNEVATLDPFEPYPGEFIFGVDWGRSNDYTAISIIDINTRQQVYIERFNQIGWQAQRNRLMTLYELWKPYRIIAEENSIGSVNIEALANEAWGEGHDTLQNDENMVNEFNAYALRRLPSGRFAFEAPGGGHDDTVIATALSWHGLTESGYRGN
jgi:hypothetical protein